MKQEELNEILRKHKLWLEEEDGECADLSSANLSNADLSNADLRGANLENVDLDYSCFPLWCGGLQINIDNKLAIQLLYHLLNNVAYSKNVSEDIKNTLLTDDLVNLANKFHNVDECGKIHPIEGDKNGKND